MVRAEAVFSRRIVTGKVYAAGEKRGIDKYI